MGILGKLISSVIPIGLELDEFSNVTSEDKAIKTALEFVRGSISLDEAIRQLSNAGFDNKDIEAILINADRMWDMINEY